jgi:hypothetical protein
MKAKQSLQNKIRGWFPRTPTLPQQRNNLPKPQNNRVVVNHFPLAIEIKNQRWLGILIGLGIGLATLGFGAALTSNLTYNQFARVLSSEGIGTDTYFFRGLLDQIAFYLAMGTGGILTVALGALAIKNQRFNQAISEAMVGKEKHFLGNFLFGFGFGLLIYSFRFLFLYLLAPTDPILNHDFLQLKFFVGSLVVGASLFTVGILSWRQKK